MSPAASDEARGAGLALADLGDDLVARIVESCRARDPSAGAILVHGSYAIGAARPDSDLDLDLFVADPTVHYRTWFEARPGRPPLHVSARCDLTPAVWEREAGRPEDWSLGLPVRLVHRWLWCGNPDLAAAIGEDPVLHKPGGPPGVEDMVDAVLRMRRHARTGDEVGVRLEAQAAARYAAPTVAALNDPPPVADPRSAIDGIVSLPVAPPGWSADFLAASGLARSDVVEVSEAGDRLARGTPRLVRKVDPTLDGQPEVERYLWDGTFERLLE